MMHIVAPSINCPPKDFDCVLEKVRAVEHFPKPKAGFLNRLFGGANQQWIHLDIADGVFTPHKTWRNVPEWGAVDTQLKVEVHLMVDDPIPDSNAWMKAGADRLVVHAETVDAHMFHVLTALAEERGVEVMLSSNPETELSEIEELLPLAHSHQVLAVHPGLAGQKFLPRVRGKIRALRERYPHATIEVDGGINEETAKTALRAGADILVSASYIWDAENSVEAYDRLCSLA